jgi:hypothetical protein
MNSAMKDGNPKPRSNTTKITSLAAKPASAVTAKRRKLCQKEVPAS